jgi:endogenous inhibitor of DNA gyrase (YacG/DUF329 family)
MFIFAKCKNCRERSIWGHRTPHGWFCSAQCAEYYKHPGFCQTCLATTSPQSAGNTVMASGLSGTRLRWTSDKCPECGSVVQQKVRTLIFPLIPLGLYRVKYYSSSMYYSRKLSAEVFGRQRLHRIYYMHYGAMAACAVLFKLLVMVCRHNWHPVFSAVIIVVLVALMVFLVR